MSTSSSTNTEKRRPLRVLSIQSHVAHGFVGNRCATFALQLLGADVDAIQTVSLSNHTGYPSGFEGTRLSPEDIASLSKGLRANGLLRGITHILTGYIGSVPLARAVAQLVAEVKQINGAQINNNSNSSNNDDDNLNNDSNCNNNNNDSNNDSGGSKNGESGGDGGGKGEGGGGGCEGSGGKGEGEGGYEGGGCVYVCDPVLGDNGKLYVPPGLVEVYRECLIPLADVVTPNGFEVGILTGANPVPSSEDYTGAATIEKPTAENAAGGAETAAVSTASAENSAENTERSGRNGAGDRSEEAKKECSGGRGGSNDSNDVSAVSRALEDAEWFHARGVRVVVQTSCGHPLSATMSLVCSEKIGENRYSRFEVPFPTIGGYFTGTGDLAAALWLAWSAAHPDDLCVAGSKVIATMNAVIRRTSETGASEIRVVQSKADIENPDYQNFRARRL